MRIKFKVDDLKSKLVFQPFHTESFFYLWGYTSSREGFGVGIAFGFPIRRFDMAAEEVAGKVWELGKVEDNPQFRTQTEDLNGVHVFHHHSFVFHMSPTEGDPDFALAVRRSNVSNDNGKHWENLSHGGSLGKIIDAALEGFVDRTPGVILEEHPGACSGMEWTVTEFFLDSKKDRAKLDPRKLRVRLDPQLLAGEEF